MKHAKAHLSSNAFCYGVPFSHFSGVLTVFVKNGDTYHKVEMFFNPCIAGVNKFFDYEIGDIKPCQSIDFVACNENWQGADDDCVDFYKELIGIAIKSV